MKLGTVSRNQIIGLILFLELVAVAAFVFYYVMPTNKKIEGVSTEINNMVRELRGIETTKKNLNELQTEVQQFNDELKRLEQHFKQELFITRTLMLLEVLAGNTRVDIVGFKPGGKDNRARRPSGAAQNQPRPEPPKAGGKNAKPVPGQGEKPAKQFNSAQEFKESKYELYVIGQFKNVYNFINELKDFPKLVVLDSIEISMDSSMGKNEGAGAPAAAMPGASQAGSLQVKMPLTFYVQSAEPLVKLGGEKGEQEESSAAAKGSQPAPGPGALPPAGE